MPHDPLPVFGWILELKGQRIGFLDRVNFPTETLMTLQFGIGMDRAIFDWISQSLQGRAPSLPGTLIVVDTSLSPIYRDAWDWGSIKQVRLPAMEASSGRPLIFALALQITNLHEVTQEPATASAAASRARRNAPARSPTRAAGDSVRRDPFFFCFKVDVDGLPTNLSVRKLSGLSVNLGPSVVGMAQKTGSSFSSSSESVMTMPEAAAAGFRSWKQSGGRRDITIQCLSSALNPIFRFTYKGVTIEHIHPAAPLGTTSDTVVTLKLAGITLSL